MRLTENAISDPFPSFAIRGGAGAKSSADTMNRELQRRHDES
jgi:hypothetical protein